jgi:hypothetical protein
MYRVLAEVVLLAHFAFVAFVVAGGLLVLRWPRVAWAHVPCAAWGAWIELSGRICPLTPLENEFRRRAGQAGYGEGFLEHYIVPVLYPAGLTREIQIGLGVGVLLLNAGVYAWVWRRHRRVGRAAEG